MTERKGLGEISGAHTPDVPGLDHQHPFNHLRKVEPLNPTLLLIGPEFEDKPALLLLHGRCEETAPLTPAMPGGPNRVAERSARLPSHIALAAAPDCADKPVGKAAGLCTTPETETVLIALHLRRRLRAVVVVVSGYFV